MKSFVKGMGMLTVVVCASCGATQGGSVGVGAGGGRGATSGGAGAQAGNGFFPLLDGSVLPGSDAGLSADGPNCGVVHNPLQREPVDLLLVLDRSGSMKDSLVARGPSKWTETTGALDSAIMSTNATVNWGLKLFPNGQTACNVANGVDVAVAANNYTPVTGAIGLATPAGQGTPTALAITKAVQALQAATSPYKRYLVLATDGEPNCADGKSTNANDPTGPVTAIDTAAKAGFHTFVVGIATGGSSADTVLNNMAAAGLEPRTGATKYYAIASKDELVAALTEITGVVASCRFPLTTKPPVPDNVAVNIDTTRLTRDPSHTSGWDYEGAQDAVVLYGPPCDLVKGSTSGSNHNVEIIFGCPGMIIP